MTEFVFNATYTVNIPDLNESITSDPNWIHDSNNFISLSLTINNEGAQVYNKTQNPWMEHQWNTTKIPQEILNNPALITPEYFIVDHLTLQETMNLLQHDFTNVVLDKVKGDIIPNSQ